MCFFLAFFFLVGEVFFHTISGTIVHRDGLGTTEEGFHKLVEQVAIDAAASNITRGKQIATDVYRGLENFAAESLKNLNAMFSTFF